MNSPHKSGVLPSEEELVALVSAPVKRFLGKALRDDHAVEDAAAETLLVVLQQSRSGTAIENPVAFALGIAWRKSHEAFRARKRGRHAPLTDDGSSDPAAAAAGDPHRATEVREWLEAALGRLTPAERALITLRFEDDRSYREIAEILGISISLVGWRLHQARAALKAALARTGDPERAPLAFRLLPAWGGGALLGGFSTGARAAVAAAVLAALGGISYLLFGAPPSKPPAEVVAPRAIPAPAETPAEDASPIRRAPPTADPPTTQPSTAPAAPIAARDDRPRFLLHGRVTDGLGKPVRRARVGFERMFGGGVPNRDDPAPVFTDDDGDYRLFVLDDPSAVPTASMQLRAIADGFVRTSVSGLFVFEDGFEDGTRRFVRDLFLARATPLVGVVVDATTQRPIAGAVVRGSLIRTDATDLLGDAETSRTLNDYAPTETRTNADGSYALPLFRPGRPEDHARNRGAPRPYVVVLAPGYAPAVFAGDALGAETAVSADVALRPAVALEGSVVTSDGKPAAGVVVAVTSGSPPALVARAKMGGAALPPPDEGRFTSHVERRAVTGDDGRYRIANLPFGLEGVVAWRVHPEVRDTTPVDAAVADIVAGPSGARVLTAPEIRLSISRPDVVAVAVTDPDGAPVDGATVVFSRNSGPAFVPGAAMAAGRTDAQGRAALEWSAAPDRGVEYSMRVHAAGFKSVDIVRYPPAADDAQPILVVLKRAPPIAGRVVDALGKPVAGARVAAHKDGDPRAPEADVAHTDADGRFRLRSVGIDGPLRIRVRASRSRGQSGNRSGEGRRPAFEAEFAPVSTPAEDLVIALPTPAPPHLGSLIVVVLDDEGRPLRPKPLTAHLRDEGGNVGQVHDLDDGRYAFLGVPSGSYELRGGTQGLRGAALVEVPPDGTAEIRLKLHKGSIVQGIAAGPEGVLVGAEVRVVNDYTKDAVVGTTDASGRFLISGAPPFTARVTLTPIPIGPAHALVAADGSYAPHQMTELSEPPPVSLRAVPGRRKRIRLQQHFPTKPGADPTFMVVDADGRPFGLLTPAPDPALPSDGVVEAYVPIGNYRVRIRTGAATFRQVDVAITDDDAEITVPPGA